MSKPIRTRKFWLLIVVLIAASGVAIDFAIAQSSISLNSPASFPVDI